MKNKSSEKKGGSYKEPSVPVIPVKISPNSYQVVFNSKYGSNKSALPVYSYSTEISTITSQTNITIKSNSSGNYYFPIITTNTITYLTPTTNTISSPAVVVNSINQNTRVIGTTTAPNVTIVSTSIAFFCSTTNPPIANMVLTATTNSNLIPLISSVGMSSISIGDQIQFGNDRTTITSSTVTAIDTILNTVTIADNKTIPANTILTFFNATTQPILKYANNVDYQIDWTLLEKAKYKGNVSMEYFFTTNNILTGSNTQMLPHIYLNLGVDLNTYEAGCPSIANNLGGTNSNFVGVLTPAPIPLPSTLTTPYFTTSSKTTNDFYINQRPTSNTANISFFTQQNATIQSIFTKTLWMDGAGFSDYTLTLNLERIPDETLPFYNVVFNARCATLVNNASNFIQSFYWDKFLPEGKYRCSYYIVSTAQTATSTQVTSGLIVVNQLYWNIPITNTFELGSPDGVNQTQSIWSLGTMNNFVRNQIFQSWITYTTANFPFIISRPYQTNVQFRCLSSYDKAINLISTAYPYYTLCLKMELLPEK